MNRAFEFGGGLQTAVVLDEPTVGLHMADVEKHIHVPRRLVNGGEAGDAHRECLAWGAGASLS